MPDNNQQKMLSISEAAIRLGVNSKTVRRWVLAGKFPGSERLSDEHKSPYRIPESSILAFEENRKIK